MLLLRDIWDLISLGHFDPFNPVFPKVRSADHFWSAEIFNLVRKNENRSYFKLLCYKKGQLCRKTSYFMVRRRLFRDFGVRQIFLPILWSASLKSLGNTDLQKRMTWIPQVFCPKGAG